MTSRKCSECGIKWAWESGMCRACASGPDRHQPSRRPGEESVPPSASVPQSPSVPRTRIVDGEVVAIDPIATPPLGMPTPPLNASEPTISEKTEWCCGKRFHRTKSSRSGAESRSESETVEICVDGTFLYFFRCAVALHTYICMHVIFVCPS